jgi:tRNA(fMet)-specific endonuclease VapC
LISHTSLIVLDTNVLVHLVRDSTIGQRIVHDYQLHKRPEKPLISIITVGEMLSLSYKFGWGEKKRSLLSDLFQNLVIVRLNQAGILNKYAEIDYYCERKAKPARPMRQNDMWIAATASAVDAYLFTTDSDFNHLEDIFIQLIRVDPRTGQTITS